MDPGRNLRIKHQWYKSEKIGTVRWLGATFSCPHGRQRSKCKDCGGSQICEHGRLRNWCKDCGGKYICEHHRQRYQCRECGGKGFCEHGRKRSTCKQCGGSSICPHGKQKRQCRECGFQLPIKASALNVEVKAPKNTEECVPIVITGDGVASVETVEDADFWAFKCF